MRRAQKILIAFALLLTGLSEGAKADENNLAELDVEWEEGRSLNIDEEIRRQERVIGRLVEDLTSSSKEQQDLLVAQERSGLKVQLISKSQ
ncbi:MAG: hypothetical protein H6624_13450 [Bdellovibrionaceae bacterium]|nr:hypothetical protein [Bdellovibrionales bacterium]MCB9085348.1 hypothetical protein [Pseudobdellovibrionaceae bacterium]